MKKHQKGFGVVGILIIVAVLCVVAAAFYVTNMRKNTLPASTTVATQPESNPASSDESYGIIRFKNSDSFTNELKQEILSKVAEPFVYYNTEVLGLELKEVTIEINPSQMNPDDNRFSLNYRYVDNGPDIELGHAFGGYNKINYWLPQLCDDGGCMPYPEAFKQKYPATHAAYLECEAAANTGDKDKANQVCFQ